jgi:hypothetical protein
VNPVPLPHISERKTQAAEASSSTDPSRFAFQYGAAYQSPFRITPKLMERVGIRHDPVFPCGGRPASGAADAADPPVSAGYRSRSARSFWTPPFARSLARRARTQSLRLQRGRWSRRFCGSTGLPAINTGRLASRPAACPRSQEKLSHSPQPPGGSGSGPGLTSRQQLFDGQ